MILFVEMKDNNLRTRDIIRSRCRLLIMRFLIMIFSWTTNFHDHPELGESILESIYPPFWTAHWLEEHRFVLLNVASFILSIFIIFAPGWMNPDFKMHYARERQLQLGLITLLEENPRLASYVRSLELCIVRVASNPMDASGGRGIPCFHHRCAQSPIEDGKAVIGVAFRWLVDSSSYSDIDRCFFLNHLFDWHR